MNYRSLRKLQARSACRARLILSSPSPVVGIICRVACRPLMRKQISISHEKPVHFIKKIRACAREPIPNAAPTFTIRIRLPAELKSLMKTETEVIPKLLVDTPAAAFALAESESRPIGGRWQASTDMRREPSTYGLLRDFPRVGEAENSAHRGAPWNRGGLNE